MRRTKTLDEYYDALDRDELPVLRGVELYRRRPAAARDHPGTMILRASMQSIEIAHHLVNFR